MLAALDLTRRARTVQPFEDSFSNQSRALGRGVILLAIYNGAAHLEEQVQSFAGQTRTDWDMIVSDDGSSDGSLEILTETIRSLSPHHQVHLMTGPGCGFVRNFFHLLRQAPADVGWAALSDQDDVWFPEKLARATEALATLPAGQPGLYCARSLICDETLNPIRVSTLFRRPVGFRNALVQSVGGGNTMVLNRAALDLVRAAVVEAEDAAAHDWWLYQLISACGGIILRDPDPVLFYRQHGGNAIGANTSARGRLYRLLFIMGRRFSAWNDLNLRALNASRHRFTAEAQGVLDHYGAARHGGLWSRLRALRASGVYRQSRRGTLALYIACFLNRL